MIIIRSISFLSGIVYPPAAALWWLVFHRPPILLIACAAPCRVVYLFIEYARVVLLPLLLELLQIAVALYLVIHSSLVGSRSKSAASVCRSIDRAATRRPMLLNYILMFCHLLI